MQYNKDSDKAALKNFDINNMIESVLIIIKYRLPTIYMKLFTLVLLQLNKHHFN